MIVVLAVTWTYDFLHRHVFVVTPKKPGGPYCPVTLGFLHIARRGAFKENPANAWRNKNFIYKDEAKKWPLFAQVDTSTQTLRCVAAWFVDLLLARRWIGITVIGDSKSLTNHIIIMLNISPALIGSNPINVTILQWLTCGRHLWKQKTDVKIVRV